MGRARRGGAQAYYRGDDSAIRSGAGVSAAHGAEASPAQWPARSASPEGRALATAAKAAAVTKGRRQAEPVSRPRAEPMRLAGPAAH